MLFQDMLAGVATYIGTTVDTVAIIVASILLLIVLALLSYYANLEGLPLFFSMLLLVGLFIGIGWYPVWIGLVIFLASIVYLTFGGEIKAFNRGG